MKIALTGGASGIGVAVASKMKALGHSVTSFDIAEPEGVAQWIKTALSDATSITRALAQAEGPYDALINNAGMPP